MANHHPHNSQQDHLDSPYTVRGPTTRHDTPTPTTTTLRESAETLVSCEEKLLRFTKRHEVVLFFSITFYIADLCLDLWVCVLHFEDKRSRSAWFIFFCILVPNLYAGYKSLQWYLRAHEQYPVSSPVVWFVRLLFFPISPILRYIDAWVYGRRARKHWTNKNYTLEQRNFENYLVEIAEVALLRMVIIFLEDAPIVVLNLAELLEMSPSNSTSQATIDAQASLSVLPPDVNLTEIEATTSLPPHDPSAIPGLAVRSVVAKLTCTMTLGVVHYVSCNKLAWHLANTTTQRIQQQQRAVAEGGTAVTQLMRLTAPSDTKGVLSWAAEATIYCWQLLAIGSRVVAYALLWVTHFNWLWLPISLRWLLHALWIYFDVAEMSLVNSVAFGGIYLFSFITTSPGRQFCWEAKGQAESNMSIRSYYASLPPHKQLPYIRSALEDMMRYESDLQDYLASHPEHQPPSYHPIAKNDLKTYLDAHGLPALPASRPSLVFYKEVLASGQLSTMPGLQRMSEAMKMYKDVTRVEKANYKKKCEEEAEQFEEDLKEWSSEQDEVTLFALKKYREVVTLSRLLKPKRAHHTKVDDIFPHKAAAATSCPKFLGEPARPPATPYHLFSSKYRASVSETLSGPDIQRTLRDGWKALDEEEKKVYVDRCCALHKQYERKIKDYVQEMDPKTRRLFLGFNRVSLYRFFNNRDVFEEFPNSERYPLLVKGELHSSSPSKLSHHHISDHEDNKQEEEEEEEEEEILLAFPSSKKKKSLTPLLFSSLELSPTNKGSKTKLAPTATSPKKNTAQQPPCSKSEEESEDEEEIDITSDWHPPAPAAPITQAKKKAHVSVAAANAGKKSKAPRAPPPPESESESEESEDEVNVTPAVPTATTHSKKKAHVPVAAANAGKKSKASRAPQPPESESESEESEDEEDVTPAWHSPAVPTATTHAKKQQKSQLQRLQQKKQDYSSSSGFSDSDSSS